MTSKELREKFLKFFEERGHKVIPSVSLVPENDPSVLFTTAGMQQFKRYYLFPNEAPLARITTCQKCVRTGDIDEVGDESHLTFFEMLGNFSFGYPEKEGSYFKEEAIRLAWEFLTEVLDFDKKRLHATYFAGEGEVPADSESLEILGKIDGLSEIKPQGFKDNFWSLGTEGSPGGPTVEFYIDGLEVWNLVFNEFVMRDGKYVKAEMKGVDTGMGLERLLAVLNGENDVYKTDLFQPIIAKLEEITGKKYEENKKAFRIIADHIRAIVFLIADDVTTGKKDRGSILRKLIRDAEDHMIDIHPNDPLLINKLAQIVIDKYNIDTEFVKKVMGILNEELGLKRIHAEANASEINKRTKLLERFINRESDLSEGADTKWFKAAFVDREKDSPSIAAGKFAYHLFNTHRVLKDKFWDLLGENVKALIDRKEFEKGYLLGQEKFREISRVGAEKKFKGGLADNKVETTRLHTAAHLLLAALRQVLSPEVSQKGSNITEERLRFDFNWSEKLTSEQISNIENLVNEKIKAGLPVKMEEMSLEDANKAGATGTFSERYGEVVKVYTIDDFSKEICGGPHVERTGELGHFRITKEESSSAGIRRIKAVLE